MKKALLIIALMLGSVAASSAQNLDKNEAKQLKAFLSEPSRDGTNASALKVSNIGSFGSIEGVTVENGHVTSNGRTRSSAALSTFPVSRLLRKSTCRATT